MEIRTLDLSEWASALPDSGFEPFHLPEALAVVDRYTAGELELYGGFKGDEVVGLLPLFVHDRPVGRTVFSPPPTLGIPRLGPVVMPTSPKRRKQERVNRTFTEGVLERVGVGSRRTLFQMQLPTSYEDPRPYHWAGLNVEPMFTYVLETRGFPLEDLFGTFSRSLRRDIRAGQDLDVTVEVEGIESAQTVYEHIAQRYAEQGRGFPTRWEYVRDLTKALADTGHCQVYVARTADGEFLTGMITLMSNEMAYAWQGGARSRYKGVYVNNLLHWRIIEDIVQNPPRPSMTRYDLTGANTERLCRFKSKFSPDLVPYYYVESKGLSMKLAKRTYEMVVRRT